MTRDGPTEMMSGIRPVLLVFTISGVTLMLGFWVILWHGIGLIGQILSRSDVNASTSKPA